MYYEINVSLNGHHFFATAERSITSKSKLKEVYESMVKAFPKSQGYEISVSLYYNMGENIDISEISQLTNEDY